MKKRFWAADWFAGLVVAVIFLVFSGSAVLQGLERSAYDWGVKMTSRVPSSKVAVIAIDDESIANLGRWPWPRDIHAALIDILHQGHAKVIGETVFFLEPQIDPGLAYIKDLEEFYSKSSMVQEVPADLDLLNTRLGDLVKGSKAAGIKELYDFYAQSSLFGKLTGEIATLGSKLNEAESALNTDRKLAQSIADVASSTWVTGALTIFR